LQNSKDPLNRAFDALLSHEIRKLNAHLPKQRRPLGELLTASDPTVETVDGTSILIKKTELEELARIVPKERHDQVKLPIIILRTMELGKSTYTVAGSPIEEFTVRKILGTTDASFSYLYRSQPPFILYRPQVVELLRKFHSLFVIGFGIPKEISDYARSRD
jgi:uncharacterized protein (UPF0216 family)